MKYSVLDKVLKAARNNKLTTVFNTMANIRIWDGDRSRVIMDESIDGLWGISSSNTDAGATPMFGRNNLIVINAKADCISEVQVGGTRENVLKFAKEVGLNLSDDDLKVINEINAHNYDLYPETGDYNVFHELSDEEIAKLSDEEKKEYEEAAKINKDKKEGKYLRKGTAAQITV